MAHDITKAMLLEDIQAIKNDLQGQIGNVTTRLTGLEGSITNLAIEMRHGLSRMDQRFEEARLHRQALQEDLDATIRMQGKHETAIARQSKRASRNT